MSTTKPGSMLKSQIAICTFTEWDEERPGFMEIDLVAHCGNTTEGQYLNTLTCTDICTGWTDITALPRRSQQAVYEAILPLRQRLPFPLLGIDSDNGSEFINALLLCYCKDEEITFTRFVRIRKMIRHMSSKRIGPLYATLLATIAGKQIKNSFFLKAYMKIYGTISTSFNLRSNLSQKNVLAIKRSSGMIQPRHLTNAYLSAQIYPLMSKRILPITISNSIRLI